MLFIKSILVAVNAKYAHTNLAVRSIKEYAKKNGRMLDFLEFHINQPRREILSALYDAQADCYLFSCYIWNITLIRQLLDELHKVMPNSRILLGGPEAGACAHALLNEFPHITAVIKGEGEKSVLHCLRMLENNAALTDCPGIVYRQGEKIYSNAPPPPMELSELPFSYPDLDALRHRTPYYESMRGCPFSCSYCMSAHEGRVRMRPLDMVFSDILQFLAQGVKRVKFVDRTFNCDRKRALLIWRFLQEKDNGLTNFHFEISGSLLDDETIEFLSSVRPGLIQFEIGVQSANEKTLNAVRRGYDAALYENIKKLNTARNIHIHLDLIAGLPYEGFESFAHSFNTVYALAPQQLQLGFLKLLHGSNLRDEAQAYGLIAQSAAPYEVLFTPWLSFAELTELHGIEDMVDKYYNSGRFEHLLAYIVRHFSSPFACYSALFAFYRERQKGAALSNIGHYEILAAFMHKHEIPIGAYAQALCKYDMLLHEKLKKLPGWIKQEISQENRDRIFALQKLWGREVHIEHFSICPETGERKPRFLLFDYTKRDILGRAAVTGLE